MTYYVYKSGSPYTGVFGIYTEANAYHDAVKQAKLAASKDMDSKHKWKVMEYRGPNKDTRYTASSCVDKCVYWIYKDGREMITKAPVKKISEAPRGLHAN